MLHKAAFGQEKVTLSTGSAGFYTGTATVRDSAEAGEYNVDVDCAGGVSSYTLNVAGGVMPHPPRPHPTRGSHAGAGDTNDGVNLGYVGGGVMLIAGVGGYAWSRSRRTGEH
ncbi:hypothetical protein ACWGH2_24550 [Streptomyces sp. NPDC054871]